MAREAGQPADPVAVQREDHPGSIVITVSSGAALRGSPLSGGYSARQDSDISGYLAAAGPVLTIDQAGQAITTLVTDPGHDQGAYLLTAAGLALAP